VAYEFKLPDLGEGLTEAEIARWLVAEGQAVEEDDPLVEVQTDKTTVEIPSPRAGTVLKILVAEGEVAPVGAVLLTMVVGAILFSALGYDGVGAVLEIFTRPLTNPLKWQDLGVKAAPLIIIAVGLSIAYRANVWNIGAEGQYIAGALGVVLVVAAGTALAKRAKVRDDPANS